MNERQRAPSPIVHRRHGLQRTACGISTAGRQVIASYERTTVHQPLCDNCWRLKPRKVHAFEATTYYD